MACPDIKGERYVCKRENKRSRAVAIGGKSLTFRTGIDPASQSTMPVKNLAQACKIGLDFFEFLKESNRTSITERLELREIYNTEFRSRWVVSICYERINIAESLHRGECDSLFVAVYSPRTVGVKDPNFGSVLHALKVSHKITRRRDQIHFSSTVCIPFPALAYWTLGAAVTFNTDTLIHWGGLVRINNHSSQVGASLLTQGLWAEIWAEFE